MEFALVVRELTRRRLLLALGVVVAAIAAILSVYHLEGFKLKARSLQYSSASTQILVDTQSSVLGNISQSFEPLNSRAAVYAQFMLSPAILKLIGQQVGISGEQIEAQGPVDLNQAPIVVEPTALKRNVQITGETKPYRLKFESQANQPTINVYSQAPTTTMAIGLANASATALNQYVKQLQKADNVSRSKAVTIRQLGAANGAVVNGGISKALVAIVFLAVFLLWCVLILAWLRFRENWRASALLRDLEDEELNAASTAGAAGDPRASAAGMAGDPRVSAAGVVNGPRGSATMVSSSPHPLAHEAERAALPTGSVR